MTTVAKKLLLGTAAFVVAGALISPVVAVADTEDPGTDTASVGTSAAKTPKRSGRGKASAAPAPSAPTPDSTPSADTPDIPAVTSDATADALGSNPLIQNPLIWIGAPNPAPPPGTVIRSFQPLAEVPEWARPMYGWMENFEFEACVLGLSAVNKGQNVVGPYGTSTTGFSSSGCA